MKFNDQDRRRLLLTAGVGPRVLDRMEEIGVTSIDDLRRQGVANVVERVCRRMGTSAWANRRAALLRALDAAASRPG
jgi:predicted RecB family nuclease